MTRAATHTASVIGQLSHFVETASARRKMAVAWAGGGLSVLAFAPVFASPVLFLTLPVLVWLIDQSRTPRQAFVMGWWFGFGYFFFNLFWIGEAFLVEADKFAWALPFAITLLPAGLAFFWGLAVAGARFVWRPGAGRVFILAIALGCAEWLRGHVLTGLPWNVIGYALTYPLPLMQSTALFGVYALSIIAVVIFGLPLVVWDDAEGRGARPSFIKAAAVAVLPLLVLWGYGAWRLSAPQLFEPGVNLRIVQPSVPQREKWLPQFQRRIFDEHLALSQTNPEGVQDGLAEITHVVWPEAAMPFLPLDHPEALSALAAMLPDGRILITGALRRERQAADGAALPLDAHKSYNGLMVFRDDGSLSAVYDKIHLVPFGEYLPLEPILGAIGLSKLTAGRGSFSSGSEPRPMLAIAGLPPVLGLICYEVLFPGEIVQSAARPGLLFNLTNDGWFGNTTGPRQHFHQTRVRAVEEGIPVIRAANNGISAVIDRNGRVLQSLGLNDRGVIDSPLPGGAGPTPYARFGDLWLVLSLTVAALIAGVLGRISGR